MAISVGLPSSFGHVLFAEVDVMQRDHDLFKSRKNCCAACREIVTIPDLPAAKARFPAAA